MFERHATALCAKAPNAVDVQYGAETSRGPLSIADVPDLDAAGQAILKQETVLTLPTHAFVGAIQRQSTIVVGGESYKIRDYRKKTDGYLTDYYLVLIP